MQLSLFIVVSALTALLVRGLGIYMLPGRAGRLTNDRMLAELARLVIASMAAWLTYLAVPGERSFLFAVIVGSLAGVLLSLVRSN